MKKRIVIPILLLSVISILNISAQNKNEKQPSFDKAIELAAVRSTNDSVAYALGYDMAKQGIIQYLQQIGIADDPHKLNLFMKGLKESLPAKGENSAYIIGLSVGDQTIEMVQNFAKQNLQNESPDNLDMILVTRGIEDALLNKNKLVDSTEVIITGLISKTTQKAEESLRKENEEKIAKETAFLEENKTKEGVVTLPSGLQFKIIIKGNGEIPTETDKVRVLYKGSLIDGTVFDDGYARGVPAVLGVTQVIKGWTEALQLMPVGSKWELYVPAELGYGDRSHGPISAYSTLIFELDLLGIEKDNK